MNPIYIILITLTLIQPSNALAAQMPNKPNYPSKSYNKALHLIQKFQTKPTPEKYHGPTLKPQQFLTPNYHTKPPKVQNNKPPQQPQPQPKQPSLSDINKFQYRRSHSKQPGNLKKPNTLPPGIHQPPKRSSPYIK